MFTKEDSSKEWGVNKKVGMSIYRVIHLNKVINKDLLYSTGNSTEHIVITCLGEKSPKE